MRFPGRLLVIAALACGACAHAPPLDTQGPPAPDLSGTWSVTFSLDSQLTSAVNDPVLRWRRNRDTVAAEGLLTLQEPRGDRLSGRMDVDFTAMLGRPMTCYSPGKVELQVESREPRLLIAFTPGVADCGFGANVEWSGDSITGMWSETSFVGPVAVGHLRMLRQSGGP